MSRLKLDLPFISEAEVAEMVTQFEACTWPYPRWTHRAHLALGLYYLRRYPLVEALERVRKSILQYNRLVGDPVGYNETITQLFMRRMAAWNCEANAHRPIFESVDELVQTCSIEWLYRYYSKERIWSDAAKTGWLEPDKLGLDF